MINKYIIKLTLNGYDPVYVNDLSFNRNNKTVKYKVKISPLKSDALITSDDNIIKIVETHFKEYHDVQIIKEVYNG